MTYRRDDAKAHGRAHMAGIWAAALQPFKPDLSIDEAGMRANIRHRVEELSIDGLFIGGKQGEYASMTLDERKRIFEIAADATQSGGSCGRECGDRDISPSP